MTDELKLLTERWILAFCEAPPILDVELMRQVLDDLAPVQNPPP
ncbi:hypothetical protein [Brevundimonas sp. Leaf363]|nr:hypothetical protein [Brevundimonas sp. Leaf363]